MADVKLNALVDGVSGKVGKNIVLRQRGGRTLMGSRPQPSLTVSDKQRVQRENFLQGARYAKSILLVPEVKTEYETLAKQDEFMTAYTMAVRDFLTNPEIAQIDLDNYTGKVGDKILIRSAVDYKITAAKVTLLQADGSAIETGDALSNHPQRLEWEYIATQNVAALSGLKVVVTVQDRPGKETTSEKVIA